ncbi:MAG: Flp pilus assembly protein CpaB [Chloroflexi bacterium]|nr:Flp pilus assembly protein CpaB [Chloroflexota bacterium]
MKRSGRVFIIAGVALALVAGGLLFVFLNQMTQQAAVRTTPTPVPDVDVLALTRDLPAGTVITGDMLRRMPRKGNDPAIADAVRDPSEVLGRMVVTDVKADQLVKRLDLQALPFVLAKGKRAMALSVDDISSVAGLVREGDYVDVVISGKVKLVAPTPAAGNRTAPAAKPQAKPGGEEEEGDATVLPVGDQTSVKAVLQRVQVLKIVSPPAQQTPAQQQAAQQQAQQQQQAAASGTPTPAANSQPPQGRITNAKAILVLAVSDQEAELLRFANDTGGLQLLLRGRDDIESEQTKGMTLDILIRDYGLPVPRLVMVDAMEPAPDAKPTPKP